MKTNFRRLAFNLFCSLLSAMALSSCAIMSSMQNNSLQDFKVNAKWVQSNLSKPNTKYRKINRMTPVIHEDKSIIVGDAIEGLVAYDLKSKNKIWVQSIPLGVEANALGFEDRIYVGSNNGKFYSVDVNTGGIVWEIDTKSEVVAEPLLYKGILYFINGSQSLYAVEASTGRQAWVYNRQDTENSMTIRGAGKPAYYEGKILAGFSDGALVAVSETTGAAQWEINLNKNAKFKDIDSSPVIDQDKIYINSFDDKLYCLLAKDGTIFWVSDVSGGMTTPVIDGEQIYTSDARGFLYSLNKKDGKTLWQKKTKKGVFTDVLVNEELISVGESQGKLLFLSKADGRTFGAFEPGRGVFSKPIYNNKLYYFISGEANVYGVAADFENKVTFPYLK